MLTGFEELRDTSQGSPALTQLRACLQLTVLGRAV